MPGISGHADVNGLLDWIGAFEGKPQKVFVTHGDDTVNGNFLPTGSGKKKGLE